MIKKASNYIMQKCKTQLSKMAGYLWIKSKIKKLEVSILNTDNERKLLDKKVVDLKNDLQKVNLKLDSVSQKINRVANRLGI